ncbi:hypothetical protein ACOMHN_007536 [Nucella lapillus]
MENFSDDDFQTEGNTTDLSVTTSLTEYRTAVIICQVWPPFILLLGGFGNIATIFVMRRIKDHNSSQYALLTALAMSDFFLLYGGALRDWIRHTVHVDVRNVHTWTCRLHKWLMYFVSTTSAWLLTCVTVQRTTAVLWPHKMRTVWTTRRTWLVVATLVLTAFGLHFHFFLGMDISGKNRCDAVAGVYQYFYNNILPWMDMCLSSLLPCVCQFLCDIVLSYMLFKTAAVPSVTVYTSSAVSNEHQSNSRRKTASRTTVMVLALSGTFFILSLPVYVFYGIWYKYVDTYIKQTPELLANMKLVSTVTHQLWFTNGAINFFLYCLTGTKYRTEFMRWILCRVGSAIPAGASSTGKSKETQLP